MPWSAIAQTPEFGTALNIDYILVIAKTAGRLKILPDIDSVPGTDKQILLLKVA